MNVSSWSDEGVISLESCVNVYDLLDALAAATFFAIVNGQPSGPRIIGAYGQKYILEPGGLSDFIIILIAYFMSTIQIPSTEVKG